MSLLLPGLDQPASTRRSAGAGGGLRSQPALEALGCASPDARLSVSVCFQCSIQECSTVVPAHLVRGAFPLPAAPTFTLLVRQLLFFYRQSEDSKRFGECGLCFLQPSVRVFQLLIHTAGQTTPPAQLSREPPRSRRWVVFVILCFPSKVDTDFRRLFHFF